MQSDKKVIRRGNPYLYIFVLLLGAVLAVGGSVWATTIGTNISSSGTLSATNHLTISASNSASSSIIYALGVGTTTPAMMFSVGGAGGTSTGHGYFTGGLGVGRATTTAGGLETTGAGLIGGVLNVTGILTANAGLGSAVTRATGATGSFQNVAGDLTYEGAAGGTSFYHAGVMGNFLGADLTNTTSSLHAGVIGSYNVTTDDDNTGGSAGVIGEVGDLADTAAYAILAVLGGDSGTLTPRAAYGVQYFNSTAASRFDYGLDLFHAATTDYSNSAVEYGTADIRLQNQETISNATDGYIILSGIASTTSLTLLSGDTLKNTTASSTVISGKIVLSPTFSDSSSNQSVEADATFSNYTGSSYGAGVMGNAMGTINSASVSQIAGLIGKYNVDTNVTVYPSAGVIGEVGEDSANTADAAILAVLGGDDATLTGGTAYGVRYLNSNAASKFDYGLDLYSAAIGGYQAVTYRTADIRLQNQETISNSTDGVIHFAGAALLANRVATSTPTVDATLIAAQSGTTFFMGTAGVDLTLPDTTATSTSGVWYRFIVSANVETTNMTIKGPVVGASDDVIYGSVEVAGAVVACAAEDLLTFVAETNEAIQGDWVELRSDGTNWYISGSFANGSSFTCSDAD